LRFLEAAAGGAIALLAAAPAQAQVSVYPSPGTLTASPRTQISFRGVAPGEIAAVSVTGSRSGRHPGKLRAHSDGQGASFLPSRPFRAGERVSVVSTDVHYGFTIGRRPAPLKGRPTERPGVGHGGVQRFATRPDLLAPGVTIDTRLDGRAPGLVFLAAKSGRGQDGPMIIDDLGRLVWFNAIGNRELATDFRVQSYLGKPVLTWWQGRLIGGDGRGEGKIYDSSYRPIRRVRAGNGFSADLHEFELTPRGTALLVIYDAVRRDLRSVGGSRRGIVVQAVVQEIDIATGLVLFEWHSLGNIGLSESHERVSRYDGRWDYVHANSVALDAAGDFILSARHTSAVYRIRRSTGRIAWRLGGTRSSFKMGEGTRFWDQHDARPQPGGALTLFDNAAPPPHRKASRAITLALDTQRMTATLKRVFTHPRGLLASTQGGVQALPNGNTFVGWGSRRYFTEFDASGKVVFDGRFALGGDNYRAYRFPWSGRPARPPALLAERRGDRVAARVSWNGATGVAGWELWAGATPQSLTRVKGAPSAGFETAISAVTSAPYVAVKALDATGAVIGASAAIRPR
jgi:hypothetical protein